METFNAQIAQLHARNPHALRLAVLSAFAVRLEPHLLRAMRRAFMPHSDPSAELDLWHSALVASRGASAALLEIEALARLRAALSRDPQRDAAYRMTLDCLDGYPSLHLFEVELNALPVLDPEVRDEAIEEHLAPLLAALHQGGEAAQRVARWLLQAAPRWHRRVRETTAAWAALLASSALLEGRRLIPDNPPQNLRADKLAQALPALLSATRPVGVMLTGGYLRFLADTTGVALVHVPAMSPALMVLERYDGSQTQIIDAEPGSETPIGGADAVILRSLTGEAWLVERSRREAERSPRPESEKTLKERTKMIAREAAASQNLGKLDEIVDRLPEGKKRFLADTPRVREMVAGIAKAQRRVDSVDRPFLRQAYAEILVLKIEAVRGQISGFHEPLASEFGKAADAWMKRAQAQLEKIKTITGREPTPQVFRAGDPVDRTQEAFVPRLGVIDQVERQVTLATGCPGLLIYGRRRMGKSTLIRNLDAFVPDTIRIASVSMQKPDAFSSAAYFVRLIDKEVSAALTDSSAALKSEDLGGLFERLSSANSWLEAAGLRLILAIDEFENIDTKIGEGVFSADLLATIRELVQSHRRLIWLFAGSHRVTMLKNAEWPSYLISVQTIEIPPFTETETHLLLTDPLQRSPLYARDERRPRFDSSFWGEGGIAWIHAQTAGWPHLVQLLAGGAVDYANELETARLDGRALEEVARRAIVSGDMVLHQLVHGESQSDAERAYIAGFRSKDSQPPPEDEATLRSLRRREIIAEDGGVWRLKVPLMQQWLRTRG